MMKQFTNCIFFVLLLLLAASCGKNPLNPNGGNKFQTGTYTGEYNSTLGSGIIQQNFKIKVSSAGSGKYTVQQESSGDLPTFTMEEKTTSGDITFFEIPTQNSGGLNLEGNGFNSGGEDAMYVQSQKKLMFSIDIINTSNDLLYFNGTKD